MKVSIDYEEICQEQTFLIGKLQTKLIIEQLKSKKLMDQLNQIKQKEGGNEIGAN
ncbi:hypothetical protein [Niallia sp. NCCP-28]|uniref:hypothetical protein n=1 Tax=Niallia sp. NCCP-28 TaxID=2934712 RepID=UPI00208812E0|nr:hypothetical protein [Niallia sp. NCCP-28]GKU82568.1 hypothetical protein NCCP28_19640 [Niallia sp. NCCP-28]